MTYNPVQLILKKRNGKVLNSEELEYLFTAYKNNQLPSYQMAAFLMALYFRGMTVEEISDLTRIYINSSKLIKFPRNMKTVDKHSTGGVGDKVSIVLAPIVAACGGNIPMISGRGLGHTGGTLDKLESIPGFRTNLNYNEFVEQVKKIGVAIIGQSEELVPIDRATYALRDVTATIDSLPLITASIMSKKIAEGAQNLVIDLKIGSGAFIKDEQTADRLADYLLKTGENMEQRVAVIFSNMNSPLGYYVGNSLEILECIEFLHGKDIPDLKEITFALAQQMLLLSKIAKNPLEAEKKVYKCWQDKTALMKFKQLLAAQGGNSEICDKPEKLPQATYKIDIRAENSGWIKQIDCESIGYALVEIRAGRSNLDSRLDPGSGAYLPLKVGDRVERDDILGHVFCNDLKSGKKVARQIALSHIISDVNVSKENLIFKIVNPNN
ncbi:MAG: thymidine phosphorylase [Candidatus Cloacimonetes bacterium]|nr:thymidine phosphorylase [Candidatus Cloacimonadota bacterium]